MTKDEFRSEMDRLIGQFGKTVYSPARVEIFAREVSHLDASWWKSTVDQFLGECRQAPLLPELREAISKTRERSWQSQKVIPFDYAKLNAPVKCSTCRDTGVVRAELIEDPIYMYAFICGCTKGRTDGRAFPRWESANQGLYEVIR